MIVWRAWFSRRVKIYRPRVTPFKMERGNLQGLRPSSWIMDCNSYGHRLPLPNTPTCSKVISTMIWILRSKNYGLTFKIKHKERRQDFLFLSHIESEKEWHLICSSALSIQFNSRIFHGPLWTFNSCHLFQLMVKHYKPHKLIPTSCHHLYPQWEGEIDGSNDGI